MLLSGCALTFGVEATPAPVTPASVLPMETPVATEAVAAPTVEGLYQPMTLPDGLRDEMTVMQGICYEAARDASGRVFILRNAIDHIRFYGEADASALCRRPVTRYPFDFETGRILVGFWQLGRGCTAHHDLLEVERDEAAKIMRLIVRFVTEGDCPYELVRPFWISIPDAADWQIEFLQG